VTAGTGADGLLVTAATETGPGLFLVTPGEGVDLQPQRVIDGDLTARLVLADAPAERIGDADAAERTTLVATACATAEQLGVLEGALAETADYARTREQFDRPIGSFQAVSQRLADGYIDTLCLRLSVWQAVWRLDEQLPAAVEVATAKLWAADAGHRLAHTAVHVHGGVGIDLDGVTHRYFTAAKRLEFAYGGGTAQALTIGRALASG
jgi:alkylation response protein AidB-like acyl-CoA dehydrogenase